MDEGEREAIRRWKRDQELVNRIVAGEQRAKSPEQRLREVALLFRPPERHEAAEAREREVVIARERWLRLKRR